MSQWIESEIEILRTAYKDCSRPVCLSVLSRVLERDKHNISRKARSLRLTNQRRKKKDGPLKTRKPKYTNVKERNEAIGAARREWLKTHPHPRGALGMKHTEETKKKISIKSKEAWLNLNSGHHSEQRKQRSSDSMKERNKQGLMNPNYSRCRGGRRVDIENIYFRSAWEANYARYLRFLKERREITDWKYECQTFEFTTIKRGVRAYTPDFKVITLSGKVEWHEVKGWMDSKSIIRLKRFRKFYPNEKLIVIDSKWFKSANKNISRLIPGWEHGTVHV